MTEHNASTLAGTTDTEAQPVIHTGRMEVVETDEGRKFQAVCSCGWTSRLESTNRCMGNWRRHAKAAARSAVKGK